MPLPLLVPLIMAGAAATAKGVQALSTKNASDYMNDVKRQDLAASQENYNNGSAQVYNRFNRDTGQYETYVDRGNAADQFAALNDPNSQRSLDYELGGQRGFANQLSTGLGSKADQMFALQSEKANLGADQHYAGQQQGLLDAYMNQAAGGGPSVAAIQGNSALDANTRNMLAARATNSIAGQRQAMLGGMSVGMNAGANFAGQRSNEAAQAVQAATGLSGAMTNSAMSNAERQTKIDLSNRAAGDALGISYLGQQRSVNDAQFNAGNMRAADMLTADDMRKRENLAEAKGAADRHNRDVNTGLGAVSGGLSTFATAAGSGGAGVGGSK